MNADDRLEAAGRRLWLPPDNCLPSADYADFRRFATDYRLPITVFPSVPRHFSLAGRARTGHNALQWSTPDEAAMNELEPFVGRTDAVRAK
jgi:hypothetical protein